MANEYMKSINCKTDKIEAENPLEFVPKKLIHLPKGAKGDKPSFAIVGHTPFLHGVELIGQFSLETLQDCLNDLGYELRQKT